MSYLSNFCSGFKVKDGKIFFVHFRLEIFEKKILKNILKKTKAKKARNLKAKLFFFVFFTIAKHKVKQPKS